ncbi:MAG: SCO family protein [Acidobacteriota bacterium]|nr:SCO family protein [Acidobacteriota bacterium]
MSAVLLLATAAAACQHRPLAHQYRIEGQILAVNPTTQDVTIRHEEIPGLMGAMTMPFKARPSTLLAGKQPGDLVNGTLVVTPTASYLTALTTVGSMPLPGAIAAPAVLPLEPGQTVPEATLVDQDGRSRRFSAFRGRMLVLTFIYTRCPLPDYCPLMDRHFAALQRAIAARPSLRGRVRLLSVSFDPDHDTPPVLEAHARALGADPAVWTFATGTPATIDEIAGEFGVSVIRTPGDAGAGLITHSLRTAIVDPDGRLVKIYDGNTWTPDQVLADLTGATPAR